MTKKRYQKLLTAYGHYFIAKYKPHGYKDGGNMLKGFGTASLAKADNKYKSYQSMWNEWSKFIEKDGLILPKK
jgi:hypothetical protein